MVAKWSSTTNGPGASSSYWTKTDDIVSAGLAERNLKLQPEAAPETLIRRLSFDLTGLPPTPEEMEEAYGVKVDVAALIPIGTTSGNSNCPTVLRCTVTLSEP